MISPKVDRGSDCIIIRAFDKEKELGIYIFHIENSCVYGIINFFPKGKIPRILIEKAVAEINNYAHKNGEQLTHFVLFFGKVSKTKLSHIFAKQDYKPKRYTWYEKNIHAIRWLLLF